MAGRELVCRIVMNGRSPAARLAAALTAAWLVGCPPASASGPGVEGFTEPSRAAHVAAPEWGIVVDLLVREGDDVAAGQPLARLDDDLLQAQLAIARHQMQAVGRLAAALAELKVCDKRCEKLAQLQAAGAAHADEVERAQADKAAAEGRVQAEREERETLRLQHEKLRVQIARRTLVAPFAGKAIEVLKRPGEGLSPSEPGVVHLAALDPLRAVFFMKRSQAERLSVGQPVTIVFAHSQTATKGKIEYVSEWTDAESETVAVKALVSNPDGKFHSGERCVLRLD